MRKGLAVGLVTVFMIILFGYLAYAFVSDIDNHWAKASIQRLIAFGIMQGYPDGSFKPDLYVTRAELAVVIDRLIKENYRLIDLDVLEKITRAEKAVVKITGNEGQKEQIGSGVAVGPNLIVTNQHLILDTVLVETWDKQTYQAKVIANDPGLDLALLEVEGRFEPLPWGAVPNKGQKVIAIGSPLSMEDSVTVGVVSYPMRSVDGKSYIQHDASMNPGSSGGALINTLGQLIGINAWKVVRLDVEGMGFAIPATVVKEFVERVQNERNRSGNN